LAIAIFLLLRTIWAASGAPLPPLGADFCENNITLSHRFATAYRPLYNDVGNKFQVYKLPRTQITFVAGYFEFLRRIQDCRPGYFELKIITLHSEILVNTYFLTWEITHI